MPNIPSVVFPHPQMVTFELSNFVCAALFFGRRIDLISAVATIILFSIQILKWTNFLIYIRLINIYFFALLKFKYQRVINKIDCVDLIAVYFIAPTVHGKENYSKTSETQFMNQLNL